MRTRRGVAAVGLLAIVALLGWRIAERPSSDAPPREASRADRAVPAAADVAGTPKDVAPPPSGPVLQPAPPPAPPGMPQGLRVTGRVVNAAGKAVAGAR